MIKLFIDNKAIDTLPNSIRISRAAYDFENGLNERFIGRTNQFSLPLTQNNIQVLGNAGLLGATNRAFEVKRRARIEDGFILLSGVAIVEESGQEIRVQVIEDSKEFFEDLKNPVKDLDFEGSDFVYNIASYNLLKVPNPTVWVWAGHVPHVLSQTSKTVLDGNNNRKIRYTRPWFNSDTIVRKIFSSLGWSFDLESPFVEGLTALISSNHERFFVTDYQKTLNATYQTFLLPVQIDDLDNNDFENDITTGDTTINIGRHNCIFRIRGAVSLTDWVLITFTGQSSPDADYSQTQSFLINKEKTFVDIVTNVFAADTTNNTIVITVSGPGAITFQDTLLYTIIEEQTLGDLNNDEIQDFLVKAHDNLPNISMYDLLFKNYFVMFGGAFNTDSYSKKLEIFGFDEANFFNSYDWSDKFIQGSETVRTTTGPYAQTNYLGYNNDDLTFETVGRESFTIDSENLPVSVNLLDLNFSASNEAVLENYPMLSMPVYDDLERVATAGLRIGLYYLDDGNNFTLCKFDGLKFDQLGAKYYDKLISSLKRARFVDCLFNLSRLDVVGFDFAKMIYVSGLDGYYAVLNIDNYRPNIACKVRLMKVE